MVMGFSMLMWFRVFLFLLLSTSSWAGLPPTRILDEGVDKGVAFKFDCVGAGIVCSQSGVTGTLTVGTGSGGDSISIDGVAVTDPNFTSTGDVDFVDTANVVTGTVVSVRPAAENSIEALLDLQDLQGAVTDGQVPNTITIDLATLATTATTANAGDSATSFFSSGTIEDARLPTSMADKVITGSLAVPQGAAPTVDAAGEVAVDTTDDQLIYYGGAKRVIPHEQTKCAVIEDLAAADDNKSLGMFNDAVTITGVGVHCDGTCTTAADIDLSDRAGNAMTHGAPTVSTTTGSTTFTAVTAANTLTAGEGLEFSVANAVSPETDDYTLCYTFTTDAQ